MLSCSGGFPNTSMAYAYQAVSDPVREDWTLGLILECVMVTNASIVNNTYTWDVTQKPSWWEAGFGNLFEVPTNM